MLHNINAMHADKNQYFAGSRQYASLKETIPHINIYFGQTKYKYSLLQHNLSYGP